MVKKPLEAVLMQQISVAAPLKSILQLCFPGATVPTFNDVTGIRSLLAVACHPADLRLHALALSWLYCPSACSDSDADVWLMLQASH